MRFYLIIIAVTILLSSCLKQSIPDAMLGISKKNKITATMSYEINGNPVTISVDDADRQDFTYPTLACIKQGGYILEAISNSGDFGFTFYADSLKVGNYNYPSNWGTMYITTYQGQVCYVYGPTDNMNFNVTSYKDGHISGNFTGQLTPMIAAGFPNIYGTPGSILIRNGTFKNVPIVY
jgi:hypothetical protein